MVHHQRSPLTRQSWRSSSSMLLILSLVSVSSLLLSLLPGANAQTDQQLDDCGERMVQVDVDNDGRVNRAEYINLITAITPYTAIDCPNSGNIQDFLGTAPFSLLFEELACLCLTNEDGNESTACCTGNKKHLKVPGTYAPAYTVDVCTAILESIQAECTTLAPTASAAPSVSAAPSAAPAPSASTRGMPSMAPSFGPTVELSVVQIIDAGDPDTANTTVGADPSIQGENGIDFTNTPQGPQGRGINGDPNDDDPNENDNNENDNNENDNGVYHMVWIGVSVLLGVTLMFLLILLVRVCLQVQKHRRALSRNSNASHHRTAAKSQSRSRRRRQGNHARVASDGITLGTLGVDDHEYDDMMYHHDNDPTGVSPDNSERTLSVSNMDPVNIVEEDIFVFRDGDEEEGMDYSYNNHGHDNDSDNDSDDDSDDDNHDSVQEDYVMNKARMLLAATATTAATPNNNNNNNKNNNNNNLHKSRGEHGDYDEYGGYHHSGSSSVGSLTWSGGGDVLDLDCHSDDDDGSLTHATAATSLSQSIEQSYTSAELKGEELNSREMAINAIIEQSKSGAEWFDFELPSESDSDDSDDGSHDDSDYDPDHDDDDNDDDDDGTFTNLEAGLSPQEVQALRAITSTMGGTQ